MKDRARQQHLESDPGLQKVRADLQLHGVGFSWKRVPYRRPSGLFARRLMARAEGTVDDFKRAQLDDKGRQTMDASRHNAQAAAAFALTLVQPLFPTAILMRGGADGAGNWEAVIWLDPTEAEAAALEARMDAEGSPL